MFMGFMYVSEQDVTASVKKRSRDLDVQDGTNTSLGLFRVKSY